MKRKTLRRGSVLVAYRSSHVVAPIIRAGKSNEDRRHVFSSSERQVRTGRNRLDLFKCQRRHVSTAATLPSLVGKDDLVVIQ